MTASAEFVDIPAARVPVHARADVLVVGGGAAGVAAAVAAARRGAGTVLAERGTYLGGLATGGMIIALLTMDDGAGNQVVGGLCQETVDRMVARGAAHFPPPDEWGRDDETLIARNQEWLFVSGHGPHRVRYSVAYHPEEMKFAFEQMCVEAGVTMLYSTWGGEAIVSGDHLDGVVFQSKSGRFAVLADVVIDTTGDLDVLAAAGARHEKEKVLPWLWFTMSGVEDVGAAVGAAPGVFRTVGEGQVLVTWAATERVSRFIDATDVDDITYAAVASREQVMKLYDSLRRDVPALGRASLGHVADQLDVTESRRLVGEYVLSRDDLDRRFEDTVAVTGHWTKYDCVYNVPYRSLLAREFDNALAAGRCLSADHRAHHATKEIPACMATGEAAGAAAALAVRTGLGLKDISRSRLRADLSDHGAILERVE
ncbi:MAG: FAD-dependent oxidoreductase [Dehalococcoidia bacterium]